jgi:hypothetical protein
MKVLTEKKGPPALTLPVMTTINDIRPNKIKKSIMGHIDPNKYDNGLQYCILAIYYRHVWFTWCKPVYYTTIHSILVLVRSSLEVISC